MTRRRKNLPAAPRPPAPVIAPRPSALVEWLVALGLAAVTFLVYLPALSCNFVAYDDGLYVTENQGLWQGLSRGGVRWAMTAVVSANWHPVTLLSLLVDYELYGLKPFGYHLTNLLLHIANTVLLFRILRLMTGSVGRSAVVAGLFALHPLHVEAVAWVADRTDLLCTFFGLLALRAYVWYVAAPGSGRMWLVAGLLALGFLAKPIWVTFPFLLLLLDYWPLRRPDTGVSWRQLVVEKVPLFLVAAGGMALALVTHSRAGILAKFGGTVSLSARAGNAVVSYAEYLRQTFAPTDLAAYYPHPGASLGVAAVLGSALLLVGVSVLVIALRRSRPEWFVGWFWFVGTLVPLIGLVQVRDAARADRYTYVALVGIFVMLTWAAADLLRRTRLPGLAFGVAAVVLLICGLYTYAQLSHWTDPVALWTQAVRVSPDSVFARKNLVAALVTAREYEQALEEADTALRLAPDDADLHSNRGQALIGLDKRHDAEQALRTASELNPRLAEPHQLLGVLYFDKGRLDEAAECFLAAREANPALAVACVGLGAVRQEQKRLKEAEECLREALRLDPRPVEAYDRLSRVLAETGQFAEAVAVIDRGLAHADRERDRKRIDAMEQRRALFAEKRLKP